MSGSGETRRSPVLVVGEDGDARSASMHALTARGHPVFACPGPPGCALEREDRCVLVDASDAAVFLPWRPGTEPWISACAEGVEHAVFARKPPFPPGARAVVAGSLDGEALASTVHRLVAREGSRR